MIALELMTIEKGDGGAKALCQPAFAEKVQHALLSLHKPYTKPKAE
jgi:hypothetical protein